jgi:proton-translocating NADH-quinone oxidoreductase chain L
MNYNFLFIIFAPLIGFLITLIFIIIENWMRIKINSKISCLSVIGLTFFSTCLALKLFFLASSYKLGSYWFNFKLMPWFLITTNLEFDFLNLKWGTLFDSLSITMFLVIMFVSVLVQLYATEYMSHDINRTRFVGYLALFVFFMTTLVVSDNYVQMFIGWEGVGLVSYLLINFWYTRVEAARSALKAIGVNKFGDYAFIIAVIFIFKLLGTVEYDKVFSSIALYSNQNISLLFFDQSVVTIISFFLLVAAVGKSAQLGLHTWLPDAMEGPTPVSALIHAATMVTAGVYLLVRSSPILEQAPTVLMITAIIGASTALFGASTAFFQNDLKKVIAYSTCSQLGYMICACGLSAYSAAMFHLVTHAFFKALLFLCAGSVIHALSDEQDMRKMGGLSKILPFTYSMMLIGSFSLMGFPFLAGFFSKDLILEIAASTYTFVGLYCFIAGVAAAIFTALYSVRLTVLTFLTKTNSSKKIITNAHEAPILMSIPLLVLAILSVVAGWLLKPIFIETASGELNYRFWKSAIFVHTNNLENRFDIHQLSIFYKNIPTLAVFTSVAIASIIYYFYSMNTTNMYLLEWDKYLSMYKLKPLLERVALGGFYFFNKKWYFDIVYSFYLTIKFYMLSYFAVFKSIDRGLINIIIAPYTLNFIDKIIKVLKQFQTGLLYSYVYLIVTSLTVLAFILSLLVFK